MYPSTRINICCLLKIKQIKNYPKIIPIAEPINVVTKIKCSGTFWIQTSPVRFFYVYSPNRDFFYCVSSNVIVFNTKSTKEYKKINSGGRNKILKSITNNRNEILKQKNRNNIKWFNVLGKH